MDQNVWIQNCFNESFFANATISSLTNLTSTEHSNEPVHLGDDAIQTHSNDPYSDVLSHAVRLMCCFLLFTHITHHWFMFHNIVA